MMETLDTPTPEPSAEPSAEDTAPPAPEAGTPPERPKRSLQDALKHLTPDLSAPVKALEAEFTRRSQKLSALEKDHAAAIERAAAAESRLARYQASLTELGDGEIDPLADGAEDRIKKSVTEMRALAAEQKAAEEKRQQEAKAEAALGQYRAFADAYPDIESDKDLQAEVVRLLQGNAALDFETAYWAAKGRRSRLAPQAAPPPAPDPKVAARRAAAQRASTAVAPARPSPPPAQPSRQDLRKMTNAQIIELGRQMDAAGRKPR
jgi:hypothetical protein